MERIALGLAVFAMFTAGCAMATSDRLEIVGVEADRDIRPTDTVHLYDNAGWSCSGTVGDIPIECPALAPGEVVWRVVRTRPLSTAELARGPESPILGHGAAILEAGCSAAGWLVVCQ